MKAFICSTGAGTYSDLLILPNTTVVQCEPMNQFKCFKNSNRFEKTVLSELIELSLSLTIQAS